MTEERRTRVMTDALQAEIVVCAFCRGRGTDPFDIMSSLSTCSVCSGNGTVWVASPHARCAHCTGTGAVKTFTCTVCHGKGVVFLTSAARDSCPECRGSGDDGSAPAMACLHCRGHGWIAREGGAPEQPELARPADRPHQRERNDHGREHFGIDL
jgi:DnaJ-class molecular chaperone